MVSPGFQIMSILEKDAERGIENILALRGDTTKGEAVWKHPENGFDHAADLVSVSLVFRKVISINSK